MRDQVKEIVFAFKDHGWTVQKLEAELGFSNGSLGKVMNGTACLSEYRLTKLIKFREKSFENPGNTVAEEKPKKEEINISITRPLNLFELKGMCPYASGDERSLWIATERQKYGI